MPNAKWTSIHFDYGGHFSDESEWIPKGNDICSLLILKPFADTTYARLVGRICKKIGFDEATTVLKLRYFRDLNNVDVLTTIKDDEDVLLYILGCKDDIVGVLHVELMEIVSQNQISEMHFREDRASRIDVRNEDMTTSDARDKTGRISLIGPEPLVLEYEPHVLVSEPQVLETELQVLETELQVLESGTQVMEALDSGTRLDLEYNPCVKEVQLEVPTVIQNAKENEGNEDVTHGWNDGIVMKVGQQFHTKDEVKDLIQLASHMNCFSVRLLRSNTKLYVLKCADAGCKWKLRATKLKKSEYFTVRKYVKVHTCSRLTTSTIENKKKGTARMVASVLRGDYKDTLETPTFNSIIGLFQTRLGVKVSYATVRREKRQAASLIRGSPIEGFMRLPSYVYMLKKMNPDIITDVECDDEGRFKYLYIALGACMEGFSCMRRVIIMDGMHIKTDYGGALIFALAQDPDRHHYPIAIGIIDGETIVGWSWFLQHLKQGVHDSPDLVLVSDRHLSIIKAVEVVYPQAKHGFCIYHLSQNVRLHAKQGEKNEVAKRSKECARAYTVAEFTQVYAAFMESYPTVHKYISESTRKIQWKWARCYFPGKRYNIDTTNCVESINEIFKKAREYSLLPMLDAIIGRISFWFNKYRKMSRGIPLTQNMVPYVVRELHITCQEATFMAVEELNSYALEYIVTGHGGNRFMVNLQLRSCSCKRYDIDRYPCVHAIAAAMMCARNRNKFDPNELCSYFYSVEQWSKAYQKMIYPVPNSIHWDVPEDIKNLRVYPPIKNNEVGRRQTTRLPSVGEVRRKKKPRSGKSSSNQGNSSINQGNSSINQGNSSINQGNSSINQDFSSFCQGNSSYQGNSSSYPEN